MTGCSLLRGITPLVCIAENRRRNALLAPLEGENAVDEQSKGNVHQPRVADFEVGCALYRTVDVLRPQDASFVSRSNSSAWLRA